MNKVNRAALWIATLTVSVLILARLAACGPAEKAGRDELYEQMELLSNAITYIRSHYVKEVTAKDLIYGALAGMLSSLDAYSQFMDPETYREVQVDTRGEFGGLGIEISIRDGLLTIISPLEDTPAYKAGIKPGDRIVKIDGASTKNITLIDSVKKLRGKPGTDVVLTILREKAGKIFDLAVTRAVIKLESIKEAVILEDNIGYVRLAEFQERTPGDLEGALSGLKKDGMDGLILDLRNNPGGLLDAAVKVSDKFLEKGRAIVITRGREKKSEIIYKARGGAYTDMPLIVLVNGGSASASEIVAGAVQDNGRGIIIGTKTFGKGSVQTVIPLKDESALRLTTAKYLTPGGRTIHEEGIIPDVVVEFVELPGPDEIEQKVEEVFEKVEEEKVKEEEGEKAMPDWKKRDNQLLRAIDLIKGIRVYKKMGHPS